MRALDIHVLVRHPAQDDAKRPALAPRLLEAQLTSAARKARVLTFDAKAARRLGMDLLR